MYDISYSYGVIFYYIRCKVQILFGVNLFVSQFDYLFESSKYETVIPSKYLAFYQYLVQQSVLG